MFFLRRLSNFINRNNGHFIKFSSKKTVLITPKIPERLMVIQQDQSAIIKMLRNLLKNETELPKTLDIISTQRVIDFNKNNKFISQNIKEPVFQTTISSILKEKFSYQSNDRAKIKDYHLAASDHIKDLFEILKEKRPNMNIRFFELQKNDYIFYHSQKGLFSINNDQIRKTIPLYQIENIYPSFSIIEDAREYGEFTTRERNLFHEVEEQRIALSKIKNIIDLHLLDDEEINIELSESTNKKKYVAILGHGIDALLTISVILEYNFIPIIINTDRFCNDYLKLMIHENEWLIEDLSKKLQCAHEDLNTKLIELTTYLYCANKNLYCDFQGHNIQINQLYDCTGYSLKKSYLKEVPDFYIFNSFSENRYFFDLVFMIKDKSRDQFVNLDEKILEELRTKFFSKNITDLIEKDRSRMNRLVHRFGSFTLSNFDENDFEHLKEILATSEDQISKKILEKINKIKSISLKRKFFKREEIDDLKLILKNNHILLNKLVLIPEPFEFIMSYLYAIDEYLKSNNFFENNIRHIEVELRVRKALLLIEVLNNIQGQNQDYLHQFYSYVELKNTTVEDLYFSLSQMLKDELMNPVFIKIAQQLNINTDLTKENKKNSKLFELTSELNLILPKLISFLLDSDIGFNLIDYLMIDEQQEKFAVNILRILDKSSVDLNDVEHLIQITQRQMEQNRQDFFNYNQSKVHLKISSEEFANSFFEKMIDNSIDSLHDILKKEKKKIINEIKIYQKKINEPKYFTKLLKK